MRSPIFWNYIIKISYSNSFNKKFKIPKNFYARYEIILILIFLLYLRLKDEKVNNVKIQIIYDYLFDYIDYSLREITYKLDVLFEKKLSLF